MENREISLRPVADTDIDRLAGWLQKEYILKWYEDADAWLAEINGRKDAYAWLHHFIVIADGRAIGFCQYYDCFDAGDMEDWYSVTQPGDVYSIDYLIGEEDYLGKGYGKAIVASLTAMIAEEKKPRRIVVQPDESNHASNQVLLANGYAYDAEKAYYVKHFNP